MQIEHKVTGKVFDVYGVQKNEFLIYDNKDKMFMWVEMNEYIPHCNAW